MNGSPELPECIAVVICDDVYRDERTKKLVIVGTFSAINTYQLPYRHPRMHILFSLTNGRGPFELCVAIEHADSGNRLVEVNGPAELANPLDVADINVEMPPIEYHTEGKYWVTIEANGTQIGQRPFLVKRLQTPRESPP